MDGAAATGVGSVGTFAAGMLRSVQLIGSECYQQADEALSAALRAADGDDERVAAAVGLANLRFWQLADTRSAHRALDAAAGRLTDPRAADELAVQRASLWLHGGQTRRALAASREVRRRGLVPPAVLTLAAGIEILAGGLQGTVDGPVAVACPAPVREADVEPEPVQYGFLELATGLSRAVNGLDTAVDQPGRLGACERSAAVVDGIRLLWAGRPQRAQAALEWAVEGLRGRDRNRVLASALGDLAYCRALLGDATGAANAAEAAALARHPCSRLDELTVGRGRAWAAAARGEAAEARARSAATAEACERLGQPVLAAQAWYDLARFGDAARAAAPLQRLAARARALSAVPPGAEPEPVAVVLAAHVAAVVAGDVTTLTTIAAGARRRGHRLHAAEAAADAAAAHGSRQRRARDRWAVTARDLAAACEGAWTPPLARVHALDLTPREGEVAALAGRGLSNRDIAERLDLSVRTVANHLQACYDKLDVHRRSGLAYLHVLADEPASAG
jgi:DNA-binding NarL/FixJ family response regulator